MEETLFDRDCRLLASRAALGIGEASLGVIQVNVGLALNTPPPVSFDGF